MRPIEEILNDIRDDPKKIKRIFTVIWVISYSMLIIGFILIIWVYLFAR